jgi:hypothetical protein
VRAGRIKRAFDATRLRVAIFQTIEGRDLVTTGFRSAASESENDGKEIAPV